MSEFTQTIRRPQLGSDELNQLRWLLGGVLTLLSAWTIFYLEIDAWVLMGLITVATIAGLIWPRLPARVPLLVHTFAFPLVVAFFLGDLWLKGDALPAIVRLDLLLLLYRAISYRRRRDDLQVVVLGLFLIVVAGVLTVSLAFAVQLLAFAGCALALLLVLTLLQSMEDSELPPSASGAPRPQENSLPALSNLPAWASQVKWRRLFGRLLKTTDWRVVVLGGFLFAGVVGLSALLFIAIPRFQLENSLFLDRFAVHKARTGFTDSIKFGDVTEIKEDTNVALSIDVTERSQVPENPYWRMLVLDQYEKGTFKLSSTLRGSLDERRTDAVISGTVRSRGAVQWIFYLESGVSRYLPLLGAFAELRFKDLQSYQFSSSLGVVALRDEPATMTAYRVEGFGPAKSMLDRRFAELWRRHRETPLLTPPPATLQVDLGGLEAPDHRMLSQLAADIAALPLPENNRRPPAVSFIERATGWLRHNHGYSLSPRVPGGPGDPLVLWMQSREPGHCELFAGSLVLLARAAGFPARVVTGFRGGSWNDYSNSLTLRNSDAHAWAEIFDETTGSWLRADALGAPVAVENTAGAEAAVPLRRVDRGWSARLESLRIFWYRRIVSFDQHAQAEALKAMKETTENSGRRLREALIEAVADMKEWLRGPWDAIRLAQLLLVALVLLLGPWVWRESGRRGWQNFVRRMSGRPMDAVRVDAGRWLVKLATMEADTVDRAEVVAELQRLRFGARTSWPEPQKVFRRARRAVRGAGRYRATASKAP